MKRLLITVLLATVLPTIVATGCGKSDKKNAQLAFPAQAEDEEELDEPPEPEDDLPPVPEEDAPPVRKKK